MYLQNLTSTGQEATQIFKQSTHGFNSKFSFS